MKKIIVKSNLRIVMAKRGIDAKDDVIKMSKLSKPTVYKIDSGDLRTVTFGNIIKICEVLNCTFDELISIKYENQ